MKFTTPVKIEASSVPVALGTPTLALGSCFADRIGRKLQEALFPTEVNPTGIHYNPVSLSADLAPSAPEGPLFFHQGLWRSFSHHGRLAADRPETAQAQIAQAQSALNEARERAELILLTLGTAQVFVRPNGRVATNCHRLPHALFRKRRLSLEESIDSLERPLRTWLELDPRRRVILTVSPIRHLRGGLVENSRNKATLLLACDELCRSLPRTSYFPAYEILVDELRDYRFYSDTLIQPSDLAVDYIWRAFSQTYFDSRTQESLALLSKASQLAAHRLTPHSNPKALGEKGLHLLQELNRKSPELDTSSLQGHFQSWCRG